MSTKATVVVYVRVPAIDLANVAVWMKQNRIYTMAKPGGVVAKAVTYLSLLLDGQGLSPGLQTEEEAQIAFGRLCFPPMKWKVLAPTSLAVEAAGLATLGKIHVEEDYLQWGAASTSSAGLSDAELQARQEEKDAAQRKRFEENMRDIMRNSVLAGGVAMTWEEYNRKYPENPITKAEVEAAKLAQQTREGREEAERSTRREKMLADADALVEKELQAKRARRLARLKEARHEEED